MSVMRDGPAHNIECDSCNRWDNGSLYGVQASHKSLRAARSALARAGWRVGVKKNGVHMLHDYCPDCRASRAVEGEK